MAAGIGLLGLTAPAAALSPLSPLAAPQNGDRKGEEQPMVDRNFEVPPAPALSVEEALASFTIADGYRIPRGREVHVLFLDPA